MAIQIDSDSSIPDSTGAVTTPSEPVTTVQTPGDPVSTDAVPGPDVTVMSIFGPSGQQPTGTVETPGPATTRNPSVKVVNRPPRQQPAGATTAETGQTESRREARAAEARTAPTDDGR